MTRPERDVANLGLVRPPLVYLASLVAGGVLDFLHPLPFVPEGLATPVGGTLVLAAIALFAFAVGTFQGAGTPVPGDRPTTALVRTGPYRFSRNPIYLAFTLLGLGIGVWLDSLWFVVTMAAAVAVMAWIVIPREERYLEEKFGDAYRDYKACVRRWV